MDLYLVVLFAIEALVESLNQLRELRWYYGIV